MCFHKIPWLTSPMDRKVFSELLSGTRRQYVATGGTLLSTWCSETVKLIARWIYFECKDRRTGLFCLCLQLRYHRRSATPYSTANPSNQICQLKMRHWQVKVVLLFFQHDQFESFLISFPAFTFYAKENLRVYFHDLQGEILFFAGIDFVFFCRE